MLSNISNKNDQPRQAHAVLDLTSRRIKAQKIELLLKLNKIDTENKIKILEIGCGSGGISHYFATHTKLDCEVTAVDIHDNRLVKSGYTFIHVDSTVLPFDDHFFDLIISNHVIEHVGNIENQQQHLDEIFRVSKNQSTVYLAAPNRWMLIEPHYKLIFLSWLPQKWRTPYLKLSKKGTHYDCEPPSLGKLEQLINSSGFDYTNLSMEATLLFLEMERKNSFIHKLIKLLPIKLFNLLKPIIPTLIYKLKVKK